MSIAAIPSRTTNPFATCWTRPSSVPYVPCSAASVADCLDSLRANNWRGQIIGPHGVGKSTLLRSIAAAASERGIPTVLVRADRGQRLTLTGSANQLVLVDSFEVLSRWRQHRLRRRRGGLVVTTHRDAGLPTLARLSPSLTDAQRLFRALCQRASTPVTLEDLSQSYRAHSGNLREVWFDLYDLHERLTRNG